MFGRANSHQGRPNEGISQDIINNTYNFNGNKGGVMHRKNSTTHVSLNNGHTPMRG